MAEFGELKSPLQGFPLSEHWRYSLEQNWVWLEYCRVLPVLKGGSVARWHELGLQDGRRWSHSQLPYGLPLLPCHRTLSAAQRDPLCCKRLFCTRFLSIYRESTSKPKLIRSVSVRLKQSSIDLLFKMSSIFQSGSFSKAFWKI